MSLIKVAVMVTAAFLLCAGGSAAEKLDIGSKLRGLDVPEKLQQILGAMVTKMQGLEEENVALQNRTRAVAVELRQENTVVRAKLEQVTKDKEALEKSKGDLRGMLEHVQTFMVEERGDITPGGCIIETEAGIINASLENQWRALESAFEAFMKR